MKGKLACAAACAALSLPAIANTTEPEHPSYREHFAACAHESKGLKGEEHNKFMSECLKGHGDATKDEHAHKTTADAGTQQNRMRSCNEEAGRKNLHGDERRTFMSTCLKG